MKNSTYICDGCDKIIDKPWWELSLRGPQPVINDLREHNDGPFHFHSFDCLLDYGQRLNVGADALHASRPREAKKGPRPWHIEPDAKHLDPRRNPDISDLVESMMENPA